MTNPLDKLKELEAGRVDYARDIHERDIEFQHLNLHTYRRLALELANIAEDAVNTADFFARISGVIFSPSDPRIVLDQTYEFSDRHDFRDVETGVLTEVVSDWSKPFECDGEDIFVFLRELPKEERGQNGGNDV